MLISGNQCKAARGFLGWSQSELAEQAGVSRAMITDFENGSRKTMGLHRNALQDALEDAGCVFLKRENGKCFVGFPDDEPADG